MDFIKIQKMKRVSGSDSKLTCVGIEFCDEEKLRNILLRIANRYNILLSDYNIDDITNYVMSKNNHKVTNLKVITDSLIEATNIYKNEDIMTLSRKL